MKLKIDGKYTEVGFWSFLKCNILTSLVVGTIIYGGALLIGMAFIFAGGQ